MKDRTHDEGMAEIFQDDPAYGLELLNSILQDGEQSELLIALRQLTNAFGSSSGVPLLPVRTDGAPVTLELVNQLRDKQP